MKNFILIICLILIVGLGYLTFTSLNDVSDTKPILVGYNIESLNYAPLIIAKLDNAFLRHGLDVELVALKGGKEVKQALALSRVDFGTASASNFFITIASGAPVKIISPMSLAPTYLFVRPESGIDTFNDIKNKIIAVNTGGSSELEFRSVLKREGIDANSVNFVDIERAYKPIALLEKKSIDMVVVSEQEEEKYRELGAVPHQEWEEKGYSQAKMPRIVLAVNTDFLNKNKKIIENFLAAIADAHRLIKDEPKRAAKMLSRHIALGTGNAIIYTPEQIIKIWQSGQQDYVFWYEPKRLVELADVSFETNQIERRLTVEDIYDLSFAEILKEYQREIYP